jgi:hypothetical protein
VYDARCAVVGSSRAARYIGVSLRTLMYWLTRHKLAPIARVGTSLAYACDDLERLRQECRGAGNDEPRPVDLADQILVPGAGFAGYQPAPARRRRATRKGRGR